MTNTTRTFNTSYDPHINMNIDELNNLPEEILIQRIKWYPNLLVYIKVQTDKIVCAAINSNPLTLAHVSDQSMLDKYCNQAIRGDIMAFMAIRNPTPRHKVFCATRYEETKHQNYEKVKQFKKLRMVKKRSIAMDCNDEVENYIRSCPKIIKYFKNITYSMICASIVHYDKAIRFFDEEMINEVNLGEVDTNTNTKANSNVKELYLQLLSRNIMAHRHLDQDMMQAIDLIPLFMKSIETEVRNYNLLQHFGVDLSFLNKLEWLKLNPLIGNSFNLYDFKEIINDDINNISYFDMASLTKEHCIYYLENMICDALCTKVSIKSIMDSNDSHKLLDTRFLVLYRSFDKILAEMCKRVNISYSELIDEETNLRDLLIKLSKNNSFEQIGNIELNVIANTLFMDLLQEGFTTYGGLEELLKANGNLIGLVKTQTPRLIKIALIQNPLSLEHVRDKTFELCTFAVNRDKSAIKFVPDELQHKFKTGYYSVLNNNIHYQI